MVRGRGRESEGGREGGRVMVRGRGSERVRVEEKNGGRGRGGREGGRGERQG